MVAGDELGADPFQLVDGQAGQELPSDAERLLDRTVLVPLGDEPSLELLGEGEVRPVEFGQGLLADDRDEAAEIAQGEFGAKRGR